MTCTIDNRQSCNYKSRMTDMKTQPFQMRASPEWLAKIDDWRTKRRPVLSRAEAIRQLVDRALRSEEHTSELQSLMRISYAVFCLKKKQNIHLTDLYNTPFTSHHKATLLQRNKT